jgi:hypothetical protein
VFQGRISEILSELIQPSDDFVRKYGSNFEIVFYLSAKKNIPKPEIAGPGVYKKTREIEYTIFLPHDGSEAKALGDYAGPMRALLAGVHDVLDRLRLDTSGLDRKADSIVREITSDPAMFADRDDHAVSGDDDQDAGGTAADGTAPTQEGADDSFAPTLYKLSRDGSAAYYHEAWLDGASNKIIEHFGRIGTRGRTRRRLPDRSLGARENVERILAKAVADGFRPIDEEDRAWLIVEYEVDGWGSRADLEKRHRLEDALDEILGWTGLGCCDGGSIGSGTMEVACPVVRYDLAEKVVGDALAGSEFAGFKRIYREDD